MTQVLLFIFIALLPLGNLTRLSIGAVAITVNDVLLPALIVSFILYAFAKRRAVFLPPRSGWMLLFAAWAGISLLVALNYVSFGDVLVASLYWVRWLEYFAVYVIVFNAYRWFGGYEWARKVVRYLLYGQLFFIIAGFIQFIVFPDFSKYVDHGWDPHQYRLLSTFLDPNFAGIFIILGLIMGICLLLWNGQGFVARRTLGTHAVLSIVAVVLTFSRSSYLALVTAMVGVGVLKSRALLGAFVAIALVSFLFVPRVQERVLGAVSLDETVQLRFESYEQTLNIVEDNLIFGVGFNAFRYAQDERGYFRNDRGVNHDGGHAGAGSDSSVLFILATTGVPGFLFLFMGIGLIMLDAAKYFFRKKQLLQMWGAIVLLSYGTLLVHSQFLNSQFLIWNMAWMWIITGVMYAIRATSDVSETSDVAL